MRYLAPPLAAGSSSFRGKVGAEGSCVGARTVRGTAARATGVGSYSRRCQAWPLLQRVSGARRKQDGGLRFAADLSLGSLFTVCWCRRLIGKPSGCCICWGKRGAGEGRSTAGKIRALHDRARGRLPHPGNLEARVIPTQCGRHALLQGGGVATLAVIFGRGRRQREV